MPIFLFIYDPWASCYFCILEFEFKFCITLLILKTILFVLELQEEINKLELTKNSMYSDGAMKKVRI